MKIIPKLAGGGTVPPYVIFKPVTVTDTAAVDMSLNSDDSSSTKKKASTDSTKGELSNKDLFETLKGLDGLPNDMAEIAADLTKYNKLAFLGLTSMDTSSINSQYISTMYKIKVAKFNKNQFDEARKNAIANGGLNEVAISDTGKVTVMDKRGKIKQLSTKEYLSSGGQYLALTNSNLLAIRAQNPDYANQNNILGVVDNGIGLDKVTKNIMDSLSNLGTSENEYTAGVMNVEGGVLQQGKEALVDLAKKGLLQAGVVNGQVMSPQMQLDGLYKAKVVTKSQQQQALLALKYIYSTLPTNAKALLQIRGGNAKNPDAGAQQLIMQLIGSKLNSNSSVELTYKEPKVTDNGLEADESSASGKSQDPFKGLGNGPLTNIVRGIGGEVTKYQLNPGGHLTLQIDGTAYRPVDMSGGKPLGITTLSGLLHNSGIGAIVSQNAPILLGNNTVVDPSKYGEIVYKNQNFQRVFLPVIGDKIDYNLLRTTKYRSVMKKLSNPNLSEQERAQILKRSGLGYLIDGRTGLPNPNRFRLYLITDVYTSSEAGGFKPDGILKDVSKQEGIYDLMNRARKSGLTKDEAKGVKDLDEENLWGAWPGDWFNNWDHILQGTLFIPIDNNTVNAATMDNLKLKYEQVNTAEGMYQYQHDPERQAKVNNMNTTSSDVL